MKVAKINTLSAIILTFSKMFFTYLECLRTENSQYFIKLEKGKDELYGKVLFPVL